MRPSIVTKSATFAASVAVFGVSSIFLSAAPASAVPTSCGHGTVVGGNICEQTFTSGSATFTPSPQMTKLEVLLVAGGGAGIANTSPGYGASGGGGGEVKLIDFSADTATPINLVVGGAGTASSAVQGATTATALAGSPAVGVAGGASGNGHAAAAPGGGGGAGSAGSANDGGAGAVVSALAPAGSLFTGDPQCYGGGGAATPDAAHVGAATCGGGTAAADGTLTPPAVNSGGGGGGALTLAGAGASGVIVVRWTPVTVVLTFAANGHGAVVAPETVVAGTAPARPADPKATGFVFKGWFTDPGLTTPANFAAPLSADTTFYASWGPALATTGGELNPTGLPLGLGALSAGVALAIFAARRTRKSA